MTKNNKKKVYLLSIQNALVMYMTSRMVIVEEKTLEFPRILGVCETSKSYELHVLVRPVLSDRQIQQLSRPKWTDFASYTGYMRYCFAEWSLNELSQAVDLYIFKEPYRSRRRAISLQSPYVPDGPWQWIAPDGPYDWRVRAYRQIARPPVLDEDLETLATKLISWSNHCHLSKPICHILERSDSPNNKQE